MQQNNEEEEEQTLQYQHIIKQQHIQPSSNLYYYKQCLIIVVVIFCITTILNISQYHYNQNNYEYVQQKQEEFIKILNQTNLKDISYQQYNNQQSINLLLSPNLLTKQHKTYNQLISTSPNTIKRIAMSAIQPNNNQLRIYTFIKSNQIQQQTNCILTNAVNAVTSTTIQSAQKMLGEQRYGKWILLVDRVDKNVDNMWTMFVSRYGGVIDRKDTNVDADYLWIKHSITYCKRITYLHHNTKITNPSQISIPIQPNSILYTQKVSINNQIIELYNLQQVNIQQFTSSNITIGNRINNYVFIFDSKYCKFITPLNFAYYAKYTIDQIVILPILAIGQGGNVIKSILNNIHEVQNQWGDSGGKQFHIQQKNNQNSEQSKQKRSNKLRNKYQVCFVSYPTIPNQISVQQISRYTKYLGSVQQIDKTTIVISLPYIFDTTRLSKLYNVYLLLSNYTLNIRIRIHVNKSVSSLSVYQYAYTYCPTSAIMITSRLNIVFKQQILTQLLPHINQRTHYYSTKFLDSQQNIINFPPLVFSKAKFRNQLIYYDIFKHVQIFKSDLFRMLYFWILKSAEIQFYQSQASFVIPLLEMVRLKVQVIDYVGFNVKEDRVMSGKQLQQMDNIKLYFIWDIIPFNRLYPIKYNSLQNIAFRKNAPDKIQRKIHQVWLGKNPIIPFQQKLHETLIKSNKNFQIYLWKDQNITQQNFPISFALISRSLQYQKHKNRSYAAPITSLIRYELLYHLSGIYLDFKTEGIKNLSPFLKYQIFFIDIDYGEQHYIYPANVGNGIMGATKNNYHLRLVLTQLIDQDKFNYLKWNFPKMVGGYVLRKALTDRELFTMAGFGFHLFSQKPGTGIPNLCSTINIKNIQPDQQKFVVQDLKNGRIFNIAIPCRVYKQAYVVMYKILAGSWQKKGRKRQQFDQYTQDNIQLQHNRKKSTQDTEQ